MKNLHEHISDLAHADPTRPALLVCDTSGAVVEEISRAMLLARVEATAAHLKNKGLHAGDHIALEFGTSTDLLVVSWAAWAYGIVTVPLDTRRDTDALRAHKIKTSGAKLSVTHETFSKIKEDALRKLSWMPDISHEALILFTSGTTAHPKGARLTLQNLVTNAEGIIEWLRITEDDRFLVELPLHHINSTTFCLASLIAGASIAIPPQYSNSRFFEQAANSDATITSVVPSIIFDQLAQEKKFKEVENRLKLNRIQLGSAPVVVADSLEFMRKFSLPLYQGYGQTETALRVTGVPIDLPVDIYEKLVAENSIGTPMQWAQVEIADPEGSILDEDQEGELVVKGPAVMQGYVGGEPAFRDGYFLTGDIGYWKDVAGQRFFFLIGRSKEIIIKGGINVSPVAVENSLKKIEANIEQAYVIGVHDVRYGEEVGAVIVWRENIDVPSALRRLKLKLLEKNEVLSAYETPRYLTMIRAEALPMTSTGKVQRTALKKTVGSNLESLYELMHTAEFRFTVIPPQSPLAEASHTLYNHCWQPLIKNEYEYKKYLDEYLTLGAINIAGILVGQISFSYTDKKISCVSICSASFKPKLVPRVEEIPSAESVRQYLLAGNDPVMNFHHKLGAKLIEVIPGGRPDDTSSLGYTMLLRYPPAEITGLSGPVSNQLIQVVRILAGDVGAQVYAVSRPGGLAAYLAKR